MSEKKRLNAREAALLALTKIEDEDSYANLALAEVFTRHTTDERDRRLATEITYGIITYRLTLDWMIAEITGRPAEKLDRPVLYVLRIGFYQLFYLDRLPAPAVVHSTVELCKKTKKRALASFVNGVMRGALRKYNSLLWPNRMEDETAYLSVKYAHPAWMVKRWLARMDGREVEALLAANNTAPLVSARVNTLRSDRKELLTLLAESNIRAEGSKIVPEGVIFTNGGRLTGLKEYQNGLFQIQGESAMLPSRILAPSAGGYVLDACSAPGGKTTHLAALMQNTGRIVALDVYEHRLELVKANAKRLGITIIQAEQFNAQKITPQTFGMFDHILLDVPCSGLGVIRRKPDIKWKRREEDIAELAKTQTGILQKAAAVLKPGGTLVYSTCTNEPEETEEIIAAFLAEHKQFIPLKLSEYLPGEWKQGEGKFGIQLYPHLYKVDGFYIAKLRKNA